MSPGDALPYLNSMRLHTLDGGKQREITDLSVSSSLDIQVPSLNNSPDKAVWISSRRQQKDFSVKEAWKNVRTKYPKVSWHQIVWFSKCTPRHTFIMWLTLHGRLQTHDIMAKWNTGFNLSM
ncbi:RNA-directed DNA polymerase, eukaryota, reverse transcriptase zinc-binding domain protein [Tanacetum coccineum]